MRNRDRQRANKRIKNKMLRQMAAGQPVTVKFIEPQKHKPKGATRNV